MSALFDFGEFDDSIESRFKYILIETDNTMIVRGWIKAEFHADIWEEVQRREGIKGKVIGGGRIHFEPDSKRIEVYGHSIGFPWPRGLSLNHEAAAIIQSWFPNWNVSSSTEGY